MDWRKALEKPFDEDQLTRLVAQACSEQAVVASVVVGGCLLLDIEIKRDGLANRSVSISLTSLWNSLRMNQTTPPVWLVQHSMRYWLTMFETDFQVRECDSQHIFPTLKNDAWRDAYQGSDVVAEPITRDLWLSYQIERNGGSFLLVHQHLGGLKLRQDELRPLAFQNLFQRPNPVWRDHGQQVYALEVSETLYGATLLADEGIWQAVREGWGIHRLLAAAPCECHVFFTNADNADSVKALKRKVEDVFYTNTEAPLSPSLLWRTSGPWHSYEKARLESV